MNKLKNSFFALGFVFFVPAVHAATRVMNLAPSELQASIIFYQPDGDFSKFEEVSASPESVDRLKNILAFESMDRLQIFVTKLGKNINNPVFITKNTLLLQAIKDSRNDFIKALLTADFTKDDLDFSYKNEDGCNALLMSIKLKNKVVFDALLAFEEYRFFKSNIETNITGYEQELLFYFKEAYSVKDEQLRVYFIDQLAAKFRVVPFVSNGTISFNEQIHVRL